MLEELSLEFEELLLDELSLEFEELLLEELELEFEELLLDELELEFEELLLDELELELDELLLDEFDELFDRVRQARRGAAWASSTPASASAAAAWAGALAFMMSAGMAVPAMAGPAAKPRVASDAPRAMVFIFMGVAFRVKRRRLMPATSRQRPPPAPYSRPESRALQRRSPDMGIGGPRQRSISGLRLHGTGVRGR